jgi:hypothetical protein
MKEVALFVIEIDEKSKDWSSALLSTAAKGSWTNKDGEKFSLGKKGKVMLCSSTWDEDKREIYEIPEARNLFLSVINQAVDLGSSRESIYRILADQTVNLITLCELWDKGNA